MVLIKQAHQRPCIFQSLWVKDTRRNAVSIQKEHECGQLECLSNSACLNSQSILLTSFSYSWVPNASLLSVVLSRFVSSWNFHSTLLLFCICILNVFICICISYLSSSAIIPDADHWSGVLSQFVPRLAAYINALYIEGIQKSFSSFDRSSLRRHNVAQPICSTYARW